MSPFSWAVVGAADAGGGLAGRAVQVGGISDVVIGVSDD
jgi:hypothetical protein